jgi:mannose-6-phosphate isomerase-like protein (cupin superfamily)
VDTKGTLIYGLDDVTVATLGVQDLVVVSTHDALLVAARDRAQDVRKVVDALKARDDPACKMPDVVHRAWGTYQIIGREPGLQTRRVVVNPGAQISLQMHRQRSEHWIVVSGTAEVTIAGEASLIHSNQSVSIPAGTVHRLANPGPQPLLIVEVQCGSTLQEEDVVRFED